MRSSTYDRLRRHVYDRGGQYRLLTIALSLEVKRTRPGADRRKREGGDRLDGYSPLHRRAEFQNRRCADFAARCPLRIVDMNAGTKKVPEFRTCVGG